MNEQGSKMNQQQMVNPPLPMMSAPPPQLMNPQQPQAPQMLMNPPQQQQQPMMNRSYGMWGPHTQPMDLQLKFQNPNPNSMKTQGAGFVSGNKGQSKHPFGPRNNWKGKKVNKPDKRKDSGRRMDNPLSMVGGSSSAVGGILGSVPGNVGGGYQPPNLKDLQHQNRVKARKFFPKKYYNYNNNKNSYNRGKFAPRNTTSYIIRAKKSGGIAELVSPCPVTPAVLPTPIFSPSREVLVDMAKEEWGVDGYGSMKGLIRLRSPGHEGEGHEEEEEEEGGSSESDVEEHVEVERRLDHDLSRFEMIYPNYGTAGGVEYNNVLENRVDDQDTHIAQLEEENLILKERLFLMESELGDLRRRLQCLERQSRSEDINEEVVENSSENESESRGGAHSLEDNNEEMVEVNVEGGMDAKVKEHFILDGKDEVCKNEDSITEIRLQEEKKGEIKVKCVPEDEQSSDELQVDVLKDYHVCAEAPENIPAGDVCMVEVAHTGKGFVEEKQSKQEAGEREGLEKSIDEGDLTDCPSLIIELEEGSNCQQY
ncbi:unnamed protein product [Coffea canephora]|uniref:PRLI-interacting factor A n=1 Tax=Coffea canephora TaxID=49390 RepID=A0A068US13_COFCA|nr:unnamed protein product [Coffea canephora]